MLQIAIIGMGLIGTSFGAALRSAEHGAARLGPLQVAGYDRSKEAVRTAHARLALDRQAASLEDAVRDAHVVVLATPVQTIRDLLAQLVPLLSDGAIVTDVASTKAQVCAWAADLLPPHVDFVGGHPMAGREQAGASAADPTLFHEALYCLTPSASSRQPAVDLVEALVLAVGARPHYIDPEEHDSYVAGISHLPFVLSTVLVEAVSRSPAWGEMALLAASGFRDISRLASGDPIMHRDICLTNDAALRHWINEAITLLLEVREHLETRDTDRMDQLFEHARQERDRWLEHKPALRPGEDPSGHAHARHERPGWARFGPGKR